jgi:hypothetical protein
LQLITWRVGHPSQRSTTVNIPAWLICLRFLVHLSREILMGKQGLLRRTIRSFLLQNSPGFWNSTAQDQRPKI